MVTLQRICAHFSLASNDLQLKLSPPNSKVLGVFAVAMTTIRQKQIKIAVFKWLCTLKQFVHTFYMPQTTHN